MRVSNAISIVLLFAAGFAYAHVPGITKLFARLLELNLGLFYA